MKLCNVQYRVVRYLIIFLKLGFWGVFFFFADFRLQTEKFMHNQVWCGCQKSLKITT